MSEIAKTLLDMAQIPTREAQMDTARLAHDVLDQATTVDELKLVIELILLKLYESKRVNGT